MTLNDLHEIILKALGRVSRRVLSLISLPIKLGVDYRSLKEDERALTGSSLASGLIQSIGKPGWRMWGVSKT
ncbi:MAG: hypothetical protein OEY91_09545 [Nitrospirota bacterium]|nr:hypothetical protein [Nitrospirota bacterium]